jgi:hypothetical protein
MVTSAGFTARPGIWRAAGGEVGEASRSLGGVTSRLCQGLAESWGAWGNDNIGEAFCNGADGKPGFGPAADNLLTALAQMVNLLAQTGWALEVSGAGYAAADAASTVGARAPGPVRVPRPSAYRLPAVSRKLVAGDPPPPDWEFLLQLLARMVAGTEYPTGNFGALGTIVSELTTAGKAISDLADTVQGAAGLVISHNAGSAVDQFGSLAKNLVSGLKWLASQCLALASSADNLLRQKHAARIEFYASLAFLAVMFAAAQAAAFFSFGASEAGFLAAVMGQGAGLRAMLLFVLRMVIEGIVFSAGDDMIDQLARIHEGLQHGINEGELWESAGTGAVASLVTLGLGSALHAGAGISGTLATVAGWTERDAADGLAARARGMATRFAINGLNGTVGNVAGQAIFDDGHINLAQAAQGGFDMAVLGEATESGNRLTERAAAARAAADSGGGLIASVDVSSAISQARPPEGGIQAALNAIMPGSRAGDVNLAAGHDGEAGSQDAARSAVVAPARPHGQALPESGPAVKAADGTAERNDPPSDTSAAAPADLPRPAGDNVVSPAAAPDGPRPTELADLAGPPHHGDPGLAADPGLDRHVPVDPAAQSEKPASRIDGLLNRNVPEPETAGRVDGLLNRNVPEPETAGRVDGLLNRNVPEPAVADAGPVDQIVRPAGTPAAHFSDVQLADMRSAGRVPAQPGGEARLAEPVPGHNPDAGPLPSAGPAGPADGGIAPSDPAVAAAPTGRDAVAAQAADGRGLPDTTRPAADHQARTGTGDDVARSQQTPPRAHSRGTSYLDWTRDYPDRVVIDVANPRLPAVHQAKVEWGSPAAFDHPDAPGEPIPLWRGQPTPEQVMQGTGALELKDCGKIATIRSVVRRFPDLIKDMIVDNGDGTVTVYLHEIRSVYDPDAGVTVFEPTGRVAGLRMTDELPVFKDDPGMPAYANVRRAGALWAGYLEKAIAAEDQAWGLDRIREPGVASQFVDDRGFERLQAGNNQRTNAQLMAILTGRRAYSVPLGEVIRDRYGVARVWRHLLQDGRPVTVGSIAHDRSVYGLFHRHAYEITDVTTDPNGVADGTVTAENPYGFFHPDPVPVADLRQAFRGDVATLLDAPGRPVGEETLEEHLQALRAAKQGQ